MLVDQNFMRSALECGDLGPLSTHNQEYTGTRLCLTRSLQGEWLYPYIVSCSRDRWCRYL